MSALEFAVALAHGGGGLVTRVLGNKGLSDRAETASQGHWHVGGVGQIDCVCRLRRRSAYDRPVEPPKLYPWSSSQRPYVCAAKLPKHAKVIIAILLSLLPGGELLVVSVHREASDIDGWHLGNLRADEVGISNLAAT